MSKADEMFEELGFEKSNPYKNIVLYENEKKEIEFWTDMEWVECDGKMEATIIQAINEKCKELGWLE